MKAHAARRRPELDGRKLRAARKAARNGKGYTQAELAALIGSYPQEVGDWERGRRRCHRYTLKELARVLRVKQEDLTRDPVAEAVTEPGAAKAA